MKFNALVDYPNTKRNRSLSNNLENETHGYPPPHYDHALTVKNV
jgi:hypothetical protein